MGADGYILLFKRMSTFDYPRFNRYPWQAEMRQWIFWLLFLGFTWLVLSQFAEIEYLALTLAGGNMLWVAAAGSVMVLYYLVYATSFQAAFYAVEVKRNALRLLPIIFAMYFVNVVTPTGGTAGVALFVDDAARRGYSAARTMSGTILQLVSDFSALSLVLITSMIYMFFHGRLPIHQVVSAIIQIALTIFMSAVLMMGMWRPGLLLRLLRGVQRLVNGLATLMRQPKFLARGWAERYAEEMSEASRAMAHYPSRVAWAFLTMLVAHLLAMVGLYMLFLAFYGPVALGPLAAGYAVGILFWIVSPVPQGVGIVESAMTLTFISLGVPGGPAAAVTLAFRGLIFWLPVVLGFVFLKRVKTFEDSAQPPIAGQGARVPAVLLAGMGVYNLLWAIAPEMAGRLGMTGSIIPFFTENSGALAAVLYGIGLLVLAAGLWRGKRYAWWAVLVGVIVSAIIHIAIVPNYLKALAAGGLAVWLLLRVRHCGVRSDPASIRLGLSVWARVMGFALLYGIAGSYFLIRYYTCCATPLSDLWLAVRQTLGMVSCFRIIFAEQAFFSIYEPGLLTVAGLAEYFVYSVYVLAAFAWGYVLLMFERPMPAPDPANEDERQRARQVVRSHGRTSQAHLALLDDKFYYFSPGGSTVAYTVCGRKAITLGDPIGPSEDAESAIRSFLSFCRRNDWQVIFCLVEADYLGFYRRVGYRSLCLGHEGVVKLRSFTLKGNARKTLRKRFNRLTHQGYRLVVHEPPISDTILCELRQISNEWLGMARAGEKRFFLARFSEAYVRQERVALVYTPEGEISAFANLVPEYQRNGLSIDLMRRRQNIESGTMDFLFVSLIFWGRDHGYSTFNLGLSPLFGVGTRPYPPLIERFIHFIYEKGSFYDFKGLNGFKVKFRPHWMPQYLVYPGLFNLPFIGPAVAKANAGEGETLWDYFKSRPKRIQHEEPEELPLLAADSQGE
jgi:phosphatidylglycerol lysyltransferase